MHALGLRNPRGASHRGSPSGQIAKEGRGDMCNIHKVSKYYNSVQVGTWRCWVEDIGRNGEGEEDGGNQKKRKEQSEPGPRNTSNTRRESLSGFGTN